MQYSGQTLGADFTSSFWLPRADGTSLELLLRPLGLGFYQRLKHRGVLPPVPVQKVARDSKGRPVRDAEGTAVLIPDLHCPDYTRQLSDYQQVIAVLTLYESLQADSRVKFDAQPPSSECDAVAWFLFAQQIGAELERAGFTPGNLVQICKEVARLSHLVDEHLQVSQQGFSREAQAESS